MKTQADCWRAILDGKTLVSERGTLVKLAEDGTSRRNGDINKEMYFFDSPEMWEVYEKPTLYCSFKKVRKEPTYYAVDLMRNYYEVNSKIYDDYVKQGWTPCTPKTFEEIE